MNNQIKRPWYQGFYAYWFKECGSLNYLLPLLIGTVASILVMLKGIDEVLPFTLCFTSICTFASVAWQSIRLQATEWHSLVPGYTRHIVGQGHVIIIAPHILLLSTAILLQQLVVIKLLSISILLGTAFYFKCRVTSKMFSASSYLFFGIISLTIVVEEVPLWLACISAFLTLVLILFRKQFGSAFKWQPHALVDYKHALQSGWSPIPKGFLKGYGQGLNKFLFPISYFMGRSLIQYSVLVLILLMALLVINFFFIAGQPSLFVFSNLVCILAFMILWTRIQRQQAWGTLLTLPIYSSVIEAKMSYAKASEKFALCIFVCSAVLVGFIECLHFTSLDFNLSLTYSLVNTAGVLLCFAVGNMCKKSAFFSVALVFTLGFVLAITGAVVETEFLNIGLKHSAGSFVYLLFTILANRYSAKQLYTNN